MEIVCYSDPSCDAIQRVTVADLARHATSDVY